MRSSAPMIKKSNFLAAQDKENLPEYDIVTIFTPEEIEKFKTEGIICTNWIASCLIKIVAKILFILNEDSL